MQILNVTTMLYPIDSSSSLLYPIVLPMDSVCTYMNMSDIKILRELRYLVNTMEVEVLSTDIVIDNVHILTETRYLETYSQEYLQLGALTMGVQIISETTRDDFNADIESVSSSLYDVGVSITSEVRYINSQTIRESVGTSVNIDAVRITYEYFNITSNTYPETLGSACTLNHIKITKE